jgi:hypothetical protein
VATAGHFRAAVRDWGVEEDIIGFLGGSGRMDLRPFDTCLRMELGAVAELKVMGRPEGNKGFEPRPEPAGTGKGSTTTA